jgi:hypothetical protein
VSNQTVSTLERDKRDLETAIAGLEAQLESNTQELELKRQTLAATRAAAAAKLAEHNAKIEAERIEQKIVEFIATARGLDVAMTVHALGTFKTLAAELSFAGRVKQQRAARESLIKRMLGETVYPMPFPTWSAMAQAWLVSAPPPKPPQAA